MKGSATPKTITRLQLTPKRARGQRPRASGRLPRISRLMALAIRLDGLVQAGAVTSYAELARRGGVSRARLTQILNLLHLAPDLQEQILFLAPERGWQDALSERTLRSLLGEVDWERQRRRFAQLGSCQ